jgi:Tfp pilus assembly pilus retraction ATPase PilT
MQTMDAALAQLVKAGKVNRQLAETRAHFPDEFKRLLGGGGASFGPSVGPGQMAA